MARRLLIETPLGTIAVAETTEPAHPGVMIFLRSPDAHCYMPLCLVEFADDEADFPEGEPHVITRVWGDGMRDDYTVRVVHERIEEFFASGQEEPGT